MKIYAGTSGYGYKEWKGSFYPEKLPAAEMLAYYARRLPAVEINNTFYRMPSLDAARSWARQVPREFSFAVKAPQVITHIKRLKYVRQETRYFLSSLKGLGGKLGAVLFQFPGSFRQDRARLKAFLALLPPGLPCAFEFRSASWLNGDTYALLSEKGGCLCGADTDEAPLKDLTATAPWGYLRLRRAQYTPADLAGWAARLLEQKWDKAYVFFKHEADTAARGPGFAARLGALAGAGAGGEKKRPAPLRSRALRV